MEQLTINWPFSSSQTVKNYQAGYIIINHHYILTTYIVIFISSFALRFEGQAARYVLAVWDLGESWKMEVLTEYHIFGHILLAYFFLN